MTSDLDDIIINHSLFTKKLNPTMNNILSEEFKTVGLRINVNHVCNKIHIDFSSKLLGDEYVNKINILNIRDVYKKLSQIITIKPVKFYKLTPYYCEPVSDIKVEDVAGTIDAFYSISKFQDKFKPSPKIYKTNNTSTSFWLKKNVLTRESSEYVSIYNKYDELFTCNKNENIAFLQTLSDCQINELKTFFMGVIRVESKQVSKVKIASSYGLKKAYNLYDLLTSKVNVNENVLNQIYDDERLKISKYPNLNYKRFDKMNTLKLYNNDLDKIYEMQRSMGSEIQKSKMLKPYKDLLYYMTKETENEKIMIIKDVKNKIKW